MSILCIDNSETIRKVVKDCVLDLGYEFLEATNGEEGLEVAGSLNTLKLVILDWNMPVKSGRETLQELRKLYPDLKIMVLIKYEKKDEVVDAVSMGATNYMLKPFSVNLLQDKIEEVMKNAV
jgi:two-component system chemotaxis response regulator CheY